MNELFPPRCGQVSSRYYDTGVVTSPAEFAEAITTLAAGRPITRDRPTLTTYGIELGTGTQVMKKQT